MTTKHHIVFFLSCLVFLSAYGQAPIQFVENKGQWDKSVQFMGEVPAGAFFVQKSGYTVVQHNHEDLRELQEKLHGHAKGHDKNGKSEQGNGGRLRSHAYEVRLIGSNPNPEVIADKPLSGYSNYFIGNDPSKWAAECRTFQGITMREIYPNIDIRYYTNNGQLKYDFIVKPGGDLSRIALRYTGADKLEVKDKQLVIKTSVGEVKELYPYSYQQNSSGKKEVAARYVLKGNVVTFDIKGHDKTSTLVIDPTPIFASFAGSGGNQNWGFSATYGPDGAMFGAGISNSAGYPVSPGAYQTNFAGGEWDISIIKLTPDGTNRVYATYLGGAGTEQPHSLVCDPQGNLVVVGRSNSGGGLSGYPTTGANGMIGPSGSTLYDIVVTKLNATGTGIIASKRIGGTGNDGVNITVARNRSSLQYNYGDDGRSEVILDGGGNVYIASMTQSTDFPATAGSFDNSFNGGTQDGVVIKLPPDLSAPIYSGYLGGNANDAAYVLSLAPDGSVYVAGGTESSNFPGTGGSLYPTYRGGIDGFVSIINSSGSAITRSTYMGTTNYDQVYGIQFDRLGFPYVMGQTTGSWPVQNATWSQANGKQFIAKLQPDLSAFVYSTVFGSGGGSPDISPVAFLVDRCENVYVSGWGGDIGFGGFVLGGTLGLSRVNSVLQNTNDGQEFYFFVLKKNASAQLYGDFFGENGGFADHVDGGTSRFDANGMIYQAMCANCGGGSPSNFPAGPPNVWATTHTASNCNLAMLKVNMDLSGIRSGVQSAINGVVRDSAGCVPLTVDFIDTILNAVSYEWNFGDGSAQITTNTPNASHTYTAIGSYNVMLVAIDSTSCNIRDTSYITIRVGELQALPDFNPVKLQPCDSFKFRFDNTTIAPATRPFGPNSFIWDFGDGTKITAGPGPVFHSYATPNTYNVKLYLVDTGYCNAPDSIIKSVRVASVVDADFEPPPSGCAPLTVDFENTSVGGLQFVWNFGDGNTSTDENPTHTFAPGTYTITLLAIDSATCNISDSAKFTITVYSSPQALFDISTPQPPPVNTPITFNNNSSADAVKFKWLFGDGDSLETSSRASVQHEYNASKTYTACLLAYNAQGCVDSFCLDVVSVVEPAVDVPNAFTPLSGDINSIVMVRGFAIGKMKFIIYNRWGQKVFETNTNKRGWDGTFKGKLQPMDVYVYTLDVEFTDGTKASKRGDITLIR